MDPDLDDADDPDAHEPCVGPAVPVPGSSDPDVHTVRAGRSFTGDDALEPGDVWVVTFRVRVDPEASSGTEIRNHAHADVVGDGEAAEESNTVVVTVE